MWRDFEKQASNSTGFFSIFWKKIYIKQNFPTFTVHESTFSLVRFIFCCFSMSVSFRTFANFVGKTVPTLSPRCPLRPPISLAPRVLIALAGQMPSVSPGAPCPAPGHSPARRVFLLTNRTDGALRFPSLMRKSPPHLFPTLKVLRSDQRTTRAKQHECDEAGASAGPHVPGRHGADQTGVRAASSVAA